MARSMYVGQVLDYKALLTDALGTEYTAANVANESWDYDVGDTTGAITITSSGLTAQVTAVYPTIGAYLQFNCDATPANAYQGAVALASLQVDIDVLGASRLEPHASYYNGESWIEWTQPVIIATDQIGCTANGAAWKLLATLMRPTDAQWTALDITAGRGATYTYALASSDATILDLTYDQQEDGWFFRPKKPGVVTLTATGTPTLTTPGGVITGTLQVKVAGIIGGSLVEYTP